MVAKLFVQSVGGSSDESWTVTNGVLEGERRVEIWRHFSQLKECLLVCGSLSREERLVSTLSLQLLDTTEMQAIEQDIPFSVFKSSLGQVIRGRVDSFMPLTAK